jgi:hypothetical protein
METMTPYLKQLRTDDLKYNNMKSKLVKNLSEINAKQDTPKKYQYIYSWLPRDTQKITKSMAELICKGSH